MAMLNNQMVIESTFRSFSMVRSSICLTQVLAGNLRPPHGQLLAVHGQTHLAAMGDSKPGTHGWVI